MTTIAKLLILLAPLCLFACGTKSSTTPSQDPVVNFTKYSVVDPQLSAGFIDVEDLNNDGIKEIILSTLVEVNVGPPNISSRGALRIFESESALLNGPWRENIIIDTNDIANMGEGWPFINTPQVMDVDGDGIRDIVVQTGFLLTQGGAHFFMRGTANDNLDFPHSKRHYFAPTTRKELSDNYFWHESAQADLDGDGLLDIVTTAAQVQRLQNPLGSISCDEAQQPNQRCTEMKIEWYRNTGSSDLLGNPEFQLCRIAAEHNIGGVFIKLHDIDGDGDQDIVLSQFFGPPAEPSLLWLENIVAPGATTENCSGEWLVHEIDHSIGLGYHMEFADINGDGKLDLVAGSHNNQDDPRLINDDGSVILPGLYWFEIPNDPGGDETWPKHTISQDFLVTLNYGSSPHSQGVPGIFNVGDINNDGLLDIALPGDGNDKLYAILQGENGSWQQHIVDTAKQFGMAMVADVDGDGRNEIIAAQHNSLDGETTLSLLPGQLAIYQIK